MADCDFNQAALHPAYPIKCRTSTQRTQAPASVDTRRASALDPLRERSQPMADCDFNQAALQSSLPHQVPNEHAGERRHPQASTPEELLPLTH